MAELRHCVGSARFGIEPHDAPVGEFSAQPSQKDGLSRMCSAHWKQYVASLAREAKERKAAAATSEADLAGVVPAEPAAKAKRTRPKAARPANVAQEPAAE